VFDHEVQRKSAFYHPHSTSNGYQDSHPCVEDNWLRCSFWKIWGLLYHIHIVYGGRFIVVPNASPLVASYPKSAQVEIIAFAFVKPHPKPRRHFVLGETLTIQF
jgi:hypothetical protein